MITSFVQQQLYPLAIMILQQAGDAAADAGGAPAGGAADPAGQPGQQPQLFPPQMMLFMVGLFAIFYFMIMRPQQKDARRRAELLNSLKKNDKVITAGGIIGTVSEISPDGKRVTVKVDDATRIKFLRSSIQGLYDESAETETGKT